MRLNGAPPGPGPGDGPIRADDLPPSARDAVAGLWRYRERVEREAAALFTGLAADLAAAGLPALAARARVAADDEARHAVRCRAIVDACRPGLPPLSPRAVVVAPRDPGDGPPADAGRRALYTSVAMGCVTETLSCALLLAMRDAARFGPSRAAIAGIVKDELEHSRLGWAHLAAVAATGDVTWLTPHVAAMRADALRHDVAELPTTEAAGPGADDAAADLSSFGILPRARVTIVVEATWRDVIVPGLARHGIVAAPAGEG